MLNDAEKIEALQKIFVELEEPDRILVVGKLCGIAATLDRLECYRDSESVLHVIVNGVEAFQCNAIGEKSNFRNLLAVMFGSAQQFADRTKTLKLSPYNLDCVINPPKNESGSTRPMRLETVNTGSEQRFCFSKI